jgi:hypothetical protein
MRPHLVSMYKRVLLQDSRSQQIVEEIEKDSKLTESQKRRIKNSMKQLAVLSIEDLNELEKEEDELASGSESYDSGRESDEEVSIDSNIFKEDGFYKCKVCKGKNMLVVADATKHLTSKLHLKRVGADTTKQATVEGEPQPSLKRPQDPQSISTSSKKSKVSSQ